MFGANAMSGFMSGLQSIGSFIAAGQKAESDRKWQEYNNKMTRLQDAMNQNAITTNENMRKESKHKQLMQVMKSERSTLATAEVEAAATGTIGRSVNMVLKDINRNAANARQNIEKDDDWQDMQTDNQRLQSAMQTEMQIDLRHIPNPSPASLMLGIGTALVRGTQ